jgi:NAD(P)-dependent dehydrogenase (short-subunit alcohol dehydrogenase family)
MKIQGSVILITGGSSGIGADMANYFANLGAIVYICDIQNEDEFKLKERGQGKIKFIFCDVSNDSEVKKMIEDIYSQNGKLDIIVNNAGVSGGFESVDLKKAQQQFIKIFNINLLGTFLVSKYAAEKMIKNFDRNKECNGVIINIASIMGFQGIKGTTIYSASKGGVIGMTLPMTRDLGKYKIRVNCICPGLIETPFIKPLEKSIISTKKNTPINRLGLPIEIAKAAESIVNNDYMNGGILKVDGGIIANF